MGDPAKFKLIDILNKTKAPPQILDLANARIETEEEFKAITEKIPDYKIKPERDNEAAFPEEFRNSRYPRGLAGFGGHSVEPAYQFADPCPESMRGVNISDLSSVNINWKMLTLARPTTKVDEEIFSKLVQLDKLRLETKRREEEQALARGGKDPFIVVKNPSASKGGVAETSIKVCNECLEEFCGGTCRNFQYDFYQRRIVEEKEKDGSGTGARGAGAGSGAGHQKGNLATKGNKKKTAKKKKGTGGRPQVGVMPV